MSALGSPQAMRMESAHAEPDWEEGSEVVPYAGTLITVFYTIHDDGLDIDGIEHAGLVLEADDLSENMRNELVCCLRAQWDAEDE